MLKVGITGNIGSGKTTVARVFSILGIPVFYADQAAREVMTDDLVLVQGVKETFGNESYLSDGSLNRKYLADIVFNDPAELAKLNALSHPAVFRAFDAWAKKQQAPYVLKEAAILFESGSYKMCDVPVLVTCPLEKRLQRVIQRDGLTHDEALKRDARQWPEEKKAELADYLIKNDETEMVLPQVLALHQQFLALAANK